MKYRSVTPFPVLRPGDYYAQPGAYYTQFTNTVFPFDNRFDHPNEAIHQIDWVLSRPWLASCRIAVQPQAATECLDHLHPSILHLLQPVRTDGKRAANGKLPSSHAFQNVALRVLTPYLTGNLCMIQSHKHGGMEPSLAAFMLCRRCGKATPRTTHEWQPNEPRSMEPSDRSGM